MLDSSRNIIKMNFPAAWWGARWREALPSGNGKLGAAVYGSVHDETILLTHEDLWWKGYTPEMPDVSSKLPEVRSLLLGGQASEAAVILENALRKKDYYPAIAYPLPLGDLKVIMPCTNAFTDYSRSLDMETGEITVKWSDGDVDYNRKLFVSRSEDIIVYEISANKPNSVNTRIFFDLHDRADMPKEVKDANEYLPKGFEIKSEDGFIYYSAMGEDGTDFGAIARIIPNGGYLQISDGVVNVKASDSILLLVKLFVKGIRSEEFENLKSQLLTINNCYEELLESHAEEHGRIFNSVSLDLYADSHENSNEELILDAYKGEVSKEMLEKMWSFGRYLLVSSSRERGHPCHLYGLWCGDYEGKWAFNMANENIQMIYWQALSGNMPELLLTVFDYYERLMDDFRVNARNLYGCRGIFIPAPTVPDSGLLKHVTPHILHWTGAAGWISQHYYDYFLYTEDRDFLINRAMPFMKEAALFYEDFFIIGEDGYYISCPSNSPENTPGNYWDGEGMGEAMETTINATMDFAIAKELLTNLISASEITGLYKEESKKWNEMLERIPPYEINQDGAVKEWMHPYFTDNYHHRHQSHLYPVFPGTEITREENPKLFESFVTAVKKRLAVGLNEQTGWSLAHMACNYARMEEGDFALGCFDILSRTCVLNNFYTLHNDWRRMGIGVNMSFAPIQLDANMGLTAAVNEMLMFSKPGLIKLLPALPKKWARGKVNGMLARGGVKVSISWDMNSGNMLAELYSRTEQSVTVKFPAEIMKVNAGDESMGESKYGSKYREIRLLQKQKVCIDLILSVLR